jgi:hypothetical protein
MAASKAQTVPSPWRVIPARVTGPTHTRAGVDCEDRWLQVPLTERTHLFVVADGAGSRPMAGHGAQLAVEAAEAAARNHLMAPPPEDPWHWRRNLSAYLDEVLARFNHAARLMAQVSDSTQVRGDHQTASAFASTLGVLVAAPPHFGYVGIGDSFLVVRHGGRDIRLAVPMPTGRDIDSNAVFLTSANARETARVEVIHDPALDGFALCTDGMAAGALGRSSNGQVGFEIPLDHWNVFFGFADDPRSDVDDLGRRLANRDFAEASGDDKTMLLAVKRA